MGLDINYAVNFNGSAKELCQKIEVIRQKCLDIPFEEVGEIEHTLYSIDDVKSYNSLQKATMFPNNSVKNLIKRNNILRERGVDVETMIHLTTRYKPNSKGGYEFIEFHVWAGKGCENTSFIFIKKAKGWECKGWTKTQYSENFVRCHLLVIKILDLFKEENFEITVKDEGDFWETRDYKILAENINDYTNLLNSISGQLKKAVKGIDMSFKAEIDKCQNFMKVKE